MGVDRTMTWDKNTYAGHAETGVVSASRKWYFAEGATIGGFNLFYLLQNPSSAVVTVEARFLLGTGAVHTKSFQLPPNSRFNIWANVEDFNGTTPLANAELSAEFTVTAGEPTSSRSGRCTAARARCSRRATRAPGLTELGHRVVPGRRQRRRLLRRVRADRQHHGQCRRWCRPTSSSATPARSTRSSTR